MTDQVSLTEVIGSMHRLYLWTDCARLQFRTRSDTFRLLLPVGVTKDEASLADKTTPAHLMLLLRRMGVTQVCDPHRCSVLESPLAKDEWAEIKRMSHDEAFGNVQAMRC